MEEDGETETARSESRARARNDREKDSDDERPHPARAADSPWTHFEGVDAVVAGGNAAPEHSHGVSRFAEQRSQFLPSVASYRSCQAAQSSASMSSLHAAYANSVCTQNANITLLGVPLVGKIDERNRFD